MTKLFLGLIGIGLLLGGCQSRSNIDSYRGGQPAPAYVGPVGPATYGNLPHSRRQGAPNCGSRGTFSAKYGKCIGEFHDIQLTESQKATFASCERIMTRTVMKGNRLVQQQKGINCQRPR